MTIGIFLNPSSRCLLVVVWSAVMASMLKSTLLVPFIYTHAVVAKVLKRFLNKTSVGYFLPVCPLRLNRVMIMRTKG